MSWGILMLALVANPQTLSGVVFYDGPPVPLEDPKIDVNTKVCGGVKNISVVTADGRLANVALFLIRPPDASAKPEVGRLDQKRCVFLPHVQTRTQGSKLTIGNSDPIIHNVHARRGEETAFNLGMPLQDVSIDQTLNDPGLLKFGCDSGHWWMQAYAIVVPHALHAVSGAEGRFTIEGVPPGSHRLFAWHERFGHQEVTVEVRADGASSVEIRFGATQRTELSDQRLAAALRGEAEEAEVEVEVEAEAPVKPPPPPAKPTVLRSNREGRGLYLRHCADCHGIRGDGQGPSKPFLSSPPRDFRHGDLKYRTTPSGRLATLSDIARTIAVGLPGTEMPSFSARLDAEQRRAVARYVTTFSPRYAKERPAEVVEIGTPPEATPETLARGRTLYERLKCAQCHGEAGDGRGAVQTELEDDRGRPIAVADLTSPFQKGGLGVRPIYRALSTGLSGTPMPSFLKVLSDAERWDLAHYVHSMSAGAPGGWFFDPHVGRRSRPRR